MWKLLRWLGLAEIITGTQDTVYLVRIFLTPRTRWGQLLLHVFYRGDEDLDPHDHHWDFWTLPLLRDYVEEVMRPDHEYTYDGRISHYAGTMFDQVVDARRWHFRRAAHTHRVMPAPFNIFPLVTLVWRKPDIPGLMWGFWLDLTRLGAEQYCDPLGVYTHYNPRAGHRIKVPWRTYLFKEPQKEDI